MSGLVQTQSLEWARILIVDDVEANTHLLERILRRGGYTNITAITDSREFAATFLALDPDLILLDLSMPHLDGIAVLDLLRSQLPEATYLPVLVITANDSTEAMWQSFVHGARDYVTKPFNSAEVLLRVKNLLETRHLYLQLQKHLASEPTSPGSHEPAEASNTRD